ncbi:MAG: M20 aminoacylase family protein [Betaproteobacteria bacterium]
MIADIEASLPEFVAIRRDLHAHPELCFAEERTASQVAGLLERWGIPVTRGIGRTGVVGVIRRGQGQRAIGLRADMDALPLQEHNRFAHASRHEGRMHACGHDGHTAMLLAAARHLALHAEFDGTVVLIFQPAEEGGTGALAMMEDGLFDRFPVDAVFAAHNWPGLPVGSFAVSPGPMMASCNEFSIVVHGKGAHAAMPDQGVDAIQVAFQIGTALQAIVSRNVKPTEPVVLSVTQVHAGDALNVLPDSCELRGTVRCFSIEARDFVEARMRELVQHIGAAHGARCEMHFKCNCPPTTNHPFETAFVQRVLRDLVGAGNVRPFEPTMSAEDFSFMLQAKAGCYFMIGNGEGDHRSAGHGLGPCMLHNPSFDFNDVLIPIGAAAWVRLAQAWLAEERK